MSSPIQMTEGGSFCCSSVSNFSIVGEDFGSVGVNVKARFDFSFNCFISCEYSCNSKLKLRVIKDEVSECRDVEALQTNLMAVAEQLMKHQQLLDATLRQLLDIELEKIDSGVVKIVEDSISSADGKSG